MIRIRFEIMCKELSLLERIEDVRRLKFCTEIMTLFKRKCEYTAHRQLALINEFADFEIVFN